MVFWFELNIHPQNMKKLLISAILAITAILAFIFSPGVKTVAEEKTQSAMPTEQTTATTTTTANNQEFATVSGTLGVSIAGDKK